MLKTKIETSGELPHAVNERPVAIETHHLVLLRDVVKEGVLVVGQECVGHPNLLWQHRR